VYQDVNSATTAIRRLQGFNFYDKPMVSYIISSFASSLQIYLTLFSFLLLLFLFCQ
jgi:hypothetical protein